MTTAIPSLEVKPALVAKKAALFAADLLRMVRAMRRVAAGVSNCRVRARLLLAGSGGDCAREWATRVLAAQVRERSAPRAARPSDGKSGAPPHVDSDGGRIAQKPKRSTSSSKN